LAVSARNGPKSRSFPQLAGLKILALLKTRARVTGWGGFLRQLVAAKMVFDVPNNRYLMCRMFLLGSVFDVPNVLKD
jgi:hypothetical protein